MSVCQKSSSFLASLYGTCLIFSMFETTLGHASGHFKEAVLQPDGSMIGSGQQRRVMRRHAGEPGEMFIRERHSKESGEAMQKFFKSVSGALTTGKSAQSKAMDDGTIDQKVKSGLAHKTGKDDLHVGEVPGISWPKTWLGQKLESLQGNCHLSVGSDKGVSDYGKVGHSCAACAYDCTEGNKQRTVGASWSFSPPLSEQPAKAAHFYTILENVNGLGCSHCNDWKNRTGRDAMGLQHSYELEFSTSGTEGKHFKALMGSFLETGSGATSFPGKLFFVIKDTVPPQDIDGCKKNPGNRRFALEGANRNGELFTCERFCSAEGGCPCGFTDALGCAVHAHIGTGMMIKFAIRETADEAMAPMVDADNIEKTLGGQQWEAVATFGLDNSTEKIETILGRVVLEGNSFDQGIIAMKQSLQHKGCVPCDMFYSSVVSVGPFVTSPSDLHWVSSSDFVPPERTADSCELFRVTADRGHVLRFESGPGLVPATQDPATLFTCPQPANKTA